MISIIYSKLFHSSDELAHWSPGWFWSCHDNIYLNPPLRLYNSIMNPQPPPQGGEGVGVGVGQGIGSQVSKFTIYTLLVTTDSRSVLHENHIIPLNSSLPLLRRKMSGPLFLNLKLSFLKRFLWAIPTTRLQLAAFLTQPSLLDLLKSMSNHIQDTRRLEWNSLDALMVCGL